MKIGKLPESVLKRSVLRQIRHRRDDVLAGPAVGQDCAALEVREGEVLVVSSDPITGTGHDVGRYAIHVTVNDLAAAGAEPVGVMLTVLLPQETAEEELRGMIRDAEEVCGAFGIEIVGGHTEISDVVNRPLMSVTGIGKVKKEELLVTRQMRPGQDLVVSKWIGLEATSILAKEKETELRTVFSEAFVKTAQEFDTYLSVLEDARAAKRVNASAMHDITEGGVFGALWEMAEGAGTGLEVDLKKIPIRQETVEICEFFGVNPYQIMSSGSMLIACDDGNALVRELRAAEIEGTVIGRTTDRKDRILRNGEDVRWLDKPQTDELYRVL